MNNTLTAYGDELIIECQFQELIHQKNMDSNTDRAWMVVQYIGTNDRVAVPARGYNLPLSTTLKYRLYGKWTDTERYGKQFDVSYYEVILPNSQKGFIDYLSSLKVGIGRTRAKAIYKAFGENVWNVIENDPNQLLQIRGITEKKIKKLTDKLTDTVIERQLTKLFSGTINVSAKRIKSIKDRLGSENLLDRLSENPYILCQLNGFSFNDVDKLGLKLGIDPQDSRRIAAAADCVLENSASNGHTCLPKDQLISNLIALLSGKKGETPKPAVPIKCLTENINRFCHNKHLRYSAGMIYASRQYNEEVGIVQEIKRLLDHPANCTTCEMASYISAYEKSINITLAPSQKEAIKTVLNNPVSIITGGPGTGKSTIIRAVLWVNHQVTNGAMDPVLMAPTGRAARRMREATGYDASTIHHAIHFCGDEEMNTDMLEGNLYIIDGRQCLINTSVIRY